MPVQCGLVHQLVLIKQWMESTYTHDVENHTNYRTGLCVCVCVWHLYLLGIAFISRKTSIFMLFNGERWLSFSKICKTDTSAFSLSLFQNKLDWTFIGRFIREREKKMKLNCKKQKNCFPHEMFQVFGRVQNCLKICTWSSWQIIIIAIDFMHLLSLYSCRWISIGHPTCALYNVFKYKKAQSTAIRHHIHFKRSTESITNKSIKMNKFVSIQFVVNPTVVVSILKIHSSQQRFQHLKICAL